MPPIKTYRFRLLAYTSALMLFLLAILAYTYNYARTVILEESELRLSNTVSLLKDSLEIEERELLHYAEMVRDDLRIKEYMFMVVKVGTDSEPLQNLYSRQFAWLPVEQRLIISSTGRVLLGNKQPELAMSVLARLQQAKEEVFYLPSKRGVEMVAWAPISYQDTELGLLALTRTIDNTWLEKHRLATGGNLFIENDGVVQLSNLTNIEGKSFRPNDNGNVQIGNEVYRVSEISLPSRISQGSGLWYGVSEKELLTKLSEHSQLILILALAGGVAILWMGLVIMKNFSQPLSDLISITRSVARGDLPVLTKSDPENEIDLLSNQFAEMLHTLRAKQDEVDRVHKELQHSAITDTLTELHNRRYLQEIYPKLLGQMQRENLSLSGIMMDIDHFKQINDKYGHLGGDRCLIHFAELLKENCRANDYVFRIGGEEFLLLSLNESHEGGKILGEKIRSALEKKPVRYKDRIIAMTISVGVSHAEANTTSEQGLAQLLYYSDKALYQAKTDGRNQVRVYTSNDTDSKNVWDFVS